MSASSILSALNAPLATGKTVSGDLGVADGAFADLLAAEITDVAVIATAAPPVALTPPPPLTTEAPIDSETDAATVEPPPEAPVEATAAPAPVAPTFASFSVALPAPPLAIAPSAGTAADDSSGAGRVTAAPPAPPGLAPVSEQPRSEPSTVSDAAPETVSAAPSKEAETPLAPVPTPTADDAEPVTDTPEKAAAPIARDPSRIAQTGADVVKAALVSGGPILVPARVTALRAPTFAAVAAETAGDNAAPGESFDAPPPTAAAPTTPPDAALPVAPTPAAPAAGMVGIKSPDPRITNALVAPQADPSPDGQKASPDVAISPTAPPVPAMVKAQPTVGPSAVVEPIVIPGQAAPETPAANGAAPPPETAASAPTVTETSLSSLSRATIETTTQLVAQISRRLEGRSTRFEMALTPDGLGRVDVSLDIDADGQLAARLAFDNPLAATDLRGRADELRRQLEDAGFTLARDALEFSGRDGSSGGGQAFDRRQGRAAAYATRNAAAEAEALTAPTPWFPPNRTPSGVDVKV